MVMSFQSAPEKLPRRPAVCDPTFPGKQVGILISKKNMKLSMEWLNWNLREMIVLTAPNVKGSL